MAEEGSFAKWAADRQAGWQTPPEVIDEVVASATGAAVVSSDREPRGAMNEIWRVVTEDDRPLIVRIAHRSKERFEVESWALTRCAAAGVPCAEVLWLEQRDDPLISILVMSLLPGDLLSDVYGSMSAEQLHDVAVDLGGVVRRMQTVEVGSRGLIDGSGHVVGVSWSSYPTAWFAVDWLHEAAANAAIDLSLIDQSLGLLESATDLMRDGGDVLAHADLRYDHVLVADGRVSGLIDFEFAHVGDPLYDLAYWQYNSGTEVPVSGLLEGYAPDQPRDVVELRMGLCRLLVGLQYLGWYRSGGTPWPSLGDHIRGWLVHDTAAVAGLLG